MLGLDETIVQLGGKVLDTAENLAEDRSVTKHKLDSTSQFKLPHLIRPIALLWGMAFKTILDLLIITLAFIHIEDPTMLMATVLGVSASFAAPFLMMLKYYFQGRTAEKRDHKIAEANLKMKEMEIEAEIEMETMVLESEMDDEKLDRWVKKKEARKKRGLFNRNK